VLCRNVLASLRTTRYDLGRRTFTFLGWFYHSYAEVEKGLKDRLCIVAMKTQIKNKWDKLKEDFKACKKLLMRQTGTGWCPIKGKIVMDDDLWRKARAVSVDMSFCFIIVHVLFILLTSLHIDFCRTFLVVGNSGNKAFKI
jgi:hypothetical protein